MVGCLQRVGRIGGKLESVLEPTSPSFPFFDYVLRLTFTKVREING